MAVEGGGQLFLPFLLKHHKQVTQLQRCPCHRLAPDHPAAAANPSPTSALQELLEVLRARDPDRHYGLQVSLVSLAEFSPGVVDVLQGSPRTVLALFDEALQSAQEQLRAHHPERELLSVKPYTHARLVGAALLHDGSAGELCPKIASIGAAHIDRLITLTGTVVRTGLVKALEGRRLYECTKCKHRFVVCADLEMGGTVQLPKACPSNREKPCTGSSFRHCEEAQLFTNYQEVRLQESAQCLALGAMPHNITVILQDELAGTCQVGDDVEVTGVVIRQFQRMSPGERCHVALAVEASSISQAQTREGAVEVSPDTAAMFQEFWDAHRGCPMLGRSKLVASMAPQLYGLFHVKLATLLMLIGGVPRADGDGARIRGEVHMLLVGDPGTGKSVFMKAASKLSPRAVMTTGKTSSAAGLTAAAVQEGGQWTLEAGALVLADGGLCCIDEFDGVRESDRASIHEAMEQQTVSVAKANMVVTLQTRTAILGTCNPRGNKRYNPRQPLAAQLNISGPLMSRFDIVLLLLDDLNPAWDELISDHILESHQQQGQEVAAAQQGQQAAPAQGQPQGWTTEVLKQYIAWVRQRFSPILSPEAEELLSGYYHLRRQVAGRQTSRTTVRMLESLVRVAQAHARLMARSEVLLDDAAAAISIMELSAVDSDSVLPAGCTVPTVFEDDPDAHFTKQADRLVAAVRCGGLAEPALLTWA